MTRKIRASFSATERAINIELPKSWSELTQDELRQVYQVMAVYPDEDIRWNALRLIGGLRPARKLRGTKRRKDGKVAFLLDAMANGAMKEFVVYINGEMMLAWLTELDWLLDPGSEPVRLGTVRGVNAIDAQLHGLTFGEYLQLENLYQGFIQSKTPKALSGCMCILYPGAEWDMLGAEEVCNVMTWLCQVKNLFSGMWRNLFRPAQDGEQPNMLEVMNNQIRVLTGGDVTKEDEVLKVDCWRALTELDYKAKEAEDLKRELRKHK